jgi:fucose permease
MDFNYLQIFLTISLPIMGLAYALVGGLKIPLVERLQLDEGKVGKLVGGFGTMFGPTILLCGFLTDSLGRKGVWLVGSIAVAAAVLIFARTRTFRGALIAVLLLGIGWAAQVNVGNVLMRVAVPADTSKEDAVKARIAKADPTATAALADLKKELKQAEEHEQKRLVWAANFFDFVFGFGALITPMLLAGIFRKLGYEKGLVLLTLICSLPVILGVFANMGSAPPVPKGEEVGLSTLLGQPWFWVLGFAFLFFVPLETSVGGWATTLVMRNTPKEIPEAEAKKVASFALTGFWFGFTGSRLIVSILGSFGYMTRILGQTNEQRLLLIMAVCCLALMLSIVFLRGRKAAIGAVVLSGLACGPVFPTMMAVVLLSVPPQMMGRAVGMFFFFASVGWTVIPALIGSVARKTDNIQKGFAVASASAAIFLAFVLIRGAMLH